MKQDGKGNVFNPSGVGLKNGNFIGLPFNEENAAINLLPVPWDLTTSYRPGTSGGPGNILRESVQLDLYDSFVPDGWKAGIFMFPENRDWLLLNAGSRHLAEKYITFLENGGDLAVNGEMEATRQELNRLCHTFHQEVYLFCSDILSKGKIPGIVGGEHSVAWGNLSAIAGYYSDFGILQIDAHMDLRKSYEGLDYSHASIMYNALRLEQVTKLVQVGIRDFCEEEVEKVKEEGERVSVFEDQLIKEMQFRAVTFNAIATEIIEQLPEKVYISFDIDGLEPSLCPDTGTPVPGGLSYNEALFLLKEVVKSDRKIIGFDLSETGGNNSWDGNVGARLVYQLSILAAKSWSLA